MELVRSLLSENDNEKLSDLFIRSAINLAKSDIANRLTLSEDPWYLYSFKAGLDTIDPAAAGVVNSADVLGIDLSYLAYPTTPIAVPINLAYKYNAITNTIANPDAVNYIHKVKSVSLSGYGPLQAVSYEEYQSVLNGNNEFYKKSIIFCHQGRYVYIYNGSETVLFSSGAPATIITDNTIISTNRESLKFDVMAYRTPLLDDLLPIVDGVQWVTGSTTFAMGIDVPDRHVRILLLMVQKMCFEMLGKALDPNTDTLIEQGINSVTQKQIMLDKTIEAK